MAWKSVLTAVFSSIFPRSSLKHASHWYEISKGKSELFNCLKYQSLNHQVEQSPLILTNSFRNKLRHWVSPAQQNVQNDEPPCRQAAGSPGKSNILGMKGKTRQPKCSGSYQCLYLLRHEVSIKILISGLDESRGFIESIKFILLFYGCSM